MTKKGNLIAASFYFFISVACFFLGLGGFFFDFMEPRPFFGAKHELSVFSALLPAFILLIFAVMNIKEYFKKKL